MNNPGSNRRGPGYKLEEVGAIDIPTSSSSSVPSQSSYAKSAPPGSEHHGLIGPVMDETEALSNSISSSRSSLIERHKVAAGGLSRPPSYGTDNYKQKLVQNIEEGYEHINEKNRNKRMEHTTTDFQTFSHIVKGNIGTGLLALPYAVKNAGYIIGPIGLLLMGIIATHCMILLVKVANELCRRNNLSCLNYSEAAEVAVSEYIANRKVVKAVGIFVNIFLIITQFGFCCVYFVFMADTLIQVCCSAFDIHLTQQEWIFILLIPVMILSWIKNLEELASFSLVANLCMMFSLCVILYAVINSFLPGTTDPLDRAAALDAHNRLSSFGDVKSTALFFGGVVYAFEGIGMVLPLENKMEKPQHAKPVIYGAMVIVTLLYTIFGTVGYLVYGNDVMSSITLNLSSPIIAVSIIFLIAKLFYAYAIFASYLLQFYVPMDFLEPAVYGLLKVEYYPYRFPRFHSVLTFLVRILFRSSIVIITAGIAAAVPDLGDLISLIGAFASSALAFIFPAILDLLVFWSIRHNWHLAVQGLWIFKNVAIAGLGVIGLVLGTYASIAGIVENFTKHGSGGADCTVLWHRH